MNERTNDAVLNTYRRHGRTWARLRGDIPAECSWLDRFYRLLPPKSEVLDIGCGFGIPISRELFRRGIAVISLDGAAKMVTLSRHNLPDVPVYLADMRHLALSRRFDSLLAWDSFFRLSPADQRPMFARLAAHAEPGSALMFTSGTVEGTAVGKLKGVPLYHGSLGPDEYRALLDAAGFDVVDHVVADPSCYRTVWLARRREGCEVRAV